MIISEFEATRNKQIVAYTIEKLGGEIDFYSLFKVLYFAEKKHLMEYGSRFFCDDFYALPYGPTPSRFYDEVKAVKSGRSIYQKYIGDNVEFTDDITMKVTDLSSINPDYISESEMECILQSIEENKDLSFGQLKMKSHGQAWEKRQSSVGLITDIDIAEEEGAAADFKKYIEFVKENKRAVFK